LNLSISGGTARGIFGCLELLFFEFLAFGKLEALRSASSTFAIALCLRHDLGFDLRLRSVSSRNF
jgi:hypothetical protein